MNRCLKGVVPLVVALAATAAWANQSESANAPAVADTQSSALSPGRITLYEYPNFAGPQVTIESGMAQSLDWANFNNPLAPGRIGACGVGHVEDLLGPCLPG